MIYTGCKPQELLDPFNPPEGVEGPFTISGQNRFLVVILFSCRLILCQEIIRDNLHPKPHLFRDFQMNVYCFDQPDTVEQVSLRFIKYFFS